MEQVLRGNWRYLGGFSLLVITLISYAVGNAFAVETSNAALPKKAEKLAEKSVTAKPLSELSFYPQHRSSAKAIALNNSELRAEITARIINIPVHVGDVLNAGSVIARLECTDYRLHYEQEQTRLQSLQAELALAEYQSERASKLSSKKVLSEELLKQRETELLISQAKIGSQKVSIRQAQRNIDKCLVRTPYKAVVIKKLGQVGELVNPGMPIVRVMDALQIEVTSMIPARLVKEFTGSKRVMFVTNGREYPLTLRSVTPTIETRERTQEVRFTFDKDKPLPGTAGEINWISTQAHIPAEYLIKRHEDIGMFVVDNNIARFHQLKGAVTGRSAPISIEGDINIVTKGRYRLHDGDRILTE